MPRTYFVPSGNWTTSVTNSLDTNEGGVLNYIPNINAANVDPAEGCSKNFNATYFCGLDRTEKVINSTDGGGTSVRFDCSAEYAKCNDLKLTLSDDGILTLTNEDGTKKIWDSVTQFGASGKIAANISPIAVPEYAADGQAKSTDTTIKRRYPFNYLLAGQFLGVGEWIGSPTGTCRLMMTGPAGNPPNSLQVVTNIVGCDDSLPEDRNVSETVIDTVATRIYTIPRTYATNIGKMAFVNNLGQLQKYPDTMTEYSTEFESIGPYTFTSSAFLGNALTDSMSNTAEKCKSKCLTYTGTAGLCAGIVFDTTTNACQLLNASVYSSPRIIDTSKTYHIRQKKVKGQDISCPDTITNQSATFWNDAKKSTDMSSTSKCGLANFTATERTKLIGDVSANIVSVGPVSLLLGRLHTKYNELTNSLFNTKNSIKSKMDEFEKSKQNLADWTGEQLQNLQAMNEDRDINMTSQNYRHILWSILAIIIIIATMKMTKSAAS